MKHQRPLLALATALVTTTALAQTAATTPGNEAPRHEPPPQAYADCKGKKEGAAVQHSTPEGVVAAVCV